MKRAIEELLYFCQIFMKINDSQIYSVNSFPIEIYQIQREKRSRLWRNSSIKGYNASKKYCYGFKVHEEKAS